MIAGREIALEDASNETPIMDLQYSELSPRVASYLSRNGIATLGDLVAKHDLLGKMSYGRMMRLDVNEVLTRWAIIKARRKCDAAAKAMLVG